MLDILQAEIERGLASVRLLPAIAFIYLFILPLFGLFFLHD